MGLDDTTKAWNDPYVLVREATAQGEVIDAPVNEGTSRVEAAIRQAHQLVSPELYHIERLKQSQTAPEYATLFGTQLHEKIAALIFLTKQKLLDIEHSLLASRDIEDARRDLASYVEIIFHLHAIDALGIFYDFAAAQRASRLPGLWRNVCTRCLYLMSLLRESRDKVLAFLDERPEARQRLHELQTLAQSGSAEVFHDLAADYHAMAHAQDGPISSGPPPMYITLFQQYEGNAPSATLAGAGGRGYSSLLTARDRIEQAAVAGDTDSLLDWIASGSQAAMHTTFRNAISVMPPLKYVELLARALELETLDPVRVTAVVLELGAISRDVHPQGGIPHVNRLLVQLAMTGDARQCGVAKVAVHEIGSVKSLMDLQTLMEKAPLLEVAHEVVRVMRELRRLPMVEAILSKRPDLIPAIRHARQELHELQQLVSAAWACPSEDMASIYLDRLKVLRAVPELKQLTMAPNFVSDMAQQILSEMQTVMPWAKTSDT